jgi:hypothetical protein
MIGANMAFRRSIVGAGRFDVRLGAGALGAMEESLLFVQLRSAGARAVYVPDAVVVHHFDPDRLRPSAFLERAYVQGRGEGWMQWNWYANKHSVRSHLRWLKVELQLFRRGGRRRLAGDVADLELVRTVGHRRAYAYSRWIARERPIESRPTAERGRT